jgi:hypothetical protein
MALLGEEDVQQLAKRAGRAAVAVGSVDPGSAGWQRDVRTGLTKLGDVRLRGRECRGFYGHETVPIAAVG